MKSNKVQFVVESGRKDVALAAYNHCMERIDDTDDITAEFFELETAIGVRYQMRLTMEDVSAGLFKPIASIGNYLMACADADGDCFFKVLRK